MSARDEFDRPRWAERKFRFGAPAWQLADTVERLRGLLPRAAGLVDGLDRASAHREHDGTWSIAQNIGHLADVEDLWLERVEDLRRGRETFTPAVPSRFQAAAERHRGRELAVILEELWGRREEFVGALLAAPRDLQERSAFHERLATRMRLIDCAQFAAEHDDHHLLRIRTLLALPR